LNPPIIFVDALLWSIVARFKVLPESLLSVFIDWVFSDYKSGAECL